MKCPKCGSRRVAPILYGLPSIDEETERKLENEDLYLGGCSVSEEAPRYHCFACGKSIASPPILISKRGKEDYREIVTGIRFRDGGFLCGFQEIMIKKEGDQILLDVRSGCGKPEAFLQRAMTNVKWKKLMDRLYTKLYIHEWKKVFVDPGYMICDGEQWELKIKLSEGRVRNYSGDNAFPPYWAELKTTFRPFFHEARANFEENALRR